MAMFDTDDKFPFPRNSGPRFGSRDYGGGTKGGLGRSQLRHRPDALGPALGVGGNLRRLGTDSEVAAARRCVAPG
jgi:hypothetical protein